MIDEFAGPYFFLCNFYPHPVKYFGIEYPTLEHAYQAAKTKDHKEREQIRKARTPGIAKRLGQKVSLRENWENQKIHVMANLLDRKFRNPSLRKQLLDTHPHELIEGTLWHDQFWGICKCPRHKGKGLNTLGKLLMKLREELLDDR